MAVFALLVAFYFITSQQMAERFYGTNVIHCNKKFIKLNASIYDLIQKEGFLQKISIPIKQLSSEYGFSKYPIGNGWYDAASATNNGAPIKEGFYYAQTNNGNVDTILKCIKIRNEKLSNNDINTVFNEFGAKYHGGHHDGDGITYQIMIEDKYLIFAFYIKQIDDDKFAYIYNLTDYTNTCDH